LKSRLSSAYSLHREAYPGWQRGSVYLGLREIPGSAFELPADDANVVQRLANRADGVDKLVLQDRVQLQRIEEDVARADSAKEEPFPQRSEFACTNSHVLPDNSSSCKDQCGQTEYAASCGGVGPGPVPNPPSGCRSAGAIPAGIAFYCCPCGQ